MGVQARLNAAGHRPNSFLATHHVMPAAASARLIATCGERVLESLPHLPVPLGRRGSSASQAVCAVGLQSVGLLGALIAASVSSPCRFHAQEELLLKVQQDVRKRFTVSV